VLEDGGGGSERVTMAGGWRMLECFLWESLEVALLAWLLTPVLFWCQFRRCLLFALLLK
jgi:hypothetical protein